MSDPSPLSTEKISVDSLVPGNVYLCQVSETISCAACCGLYNVMDNSRTNLTALLEARTRQFQRLAGTIQGLDDYLRWVADHENPHRPLPEFHHCSFIGLIGENHSRVGCLLHPLTPQNKGCDFRGISYYGGMACRTYFCPSHRHLTPDHQRILVEAALDWYEYGLIATEHLLITTFLTEIHRQRRFHFSGKPDPLMIHAVGNLIRWKVDWPFRNHPVRDRIHYFFQDELYRRPAFPDPSTKTDSPAIQTILQELGSSFQSPAQRTAAERLLREAIDAVGRSDIHDTV